MTTRALAPATHAAYQVAWALFRDWCTAAQTGHKTDAVIEVYTRYHDPGYGNAVKKLGL
jgi:hypothetical protein